MPHTSRLPERTYGKPVWDVNRSAVPQRIADGVDSFCQLTAMLAKLCGADAVATLPPPLGAHRTRAVARSSSATPSAPIGACELSRL
eukprot:SAG11_NODE_2203_length_3670_cov_62.164395_2_plen_87_part_00